MKKILFAAALTSVASIAVAAEPIDFAPGTATSRVAEAQTYIYTVADDRADRLFVKNEFEFTLSANVLLNAGEDEDQGAWMSVGTTNTNGRNVFTGHSNGGSVTACGDALTAADAKVAGALEDALGERFDATEPNGCKPATP